DPPATAGDERPPVSETLHPALITPETFTRVTTRAELHDDRPVTVTRAQPEGGPDSGGEHVTTVVGDTGTLFGYTRQTAGFGAGELPSPDVAERIALAFLAEVDPGYAAGLTVQWVDRHDETIVTGDGAETAVSGMKVKTRHDSGLYAWVIVGAGTEIVTYERDIRWDPSNARRHTAMWLHDAWNAARDAGGDELGGMHAPLDS
ncbi:hypothetical protein, partial [Leucobacter sp. M11]|uniref:hypothetical protein n=1 Tax=Leucobacter sp. M11 TaxID=2993565 RepID=UPI002D808778